VSPERDFGVRRAVESLDEDHREVLLLREYEGLSYDEIAAALRIPVNTVRSRLFRARMALRSLLEPLPQKLHCKPEPAGANPLEQES
jgi:RNA polymerase sigma-70 factor (ECF subfamily)